MEVLNVANSNAGVIDVYFGEIFISIRVSWYDDDIFFNFFLWSFDVVVDDRPRFNLNFEESVSGRTYRLGHQVILFGV